MADRTLFCDHCGRILPGEAFGRGDAYLVQGRPYCSPCRPPELITDRRPPRSLPEEPPATKIIPVMKAIGTPTAFLVVGGLAAASAVVAIVLTAVGAARHAGAPESDFLPAPSPASTIPVPPDPEEAERRIRQLEQRVAASTDPDAILQWCEEARPALQDTPFEARRRGLEVRAREEKARRATDLDPLLAELRKALAARAVDGRRRDLEALLAAALHVAGPRREEVTPLKAEYDRQVEEAERRVGLVGRWTFDEPSGVEAKDSSGRGHHARMAGGALRVPGRAGGAVRFAGPADPVELPDATELDVSPDGSFTLAAWYRPESVPADSEQVILARGEPPLGLRYARGGRFVMAHVLEGDLEAGAAAPEPLPPCEWHHVAGVVDLQAGATQIYVNGRLARTAFWAPGTRGRAADGARWKIGAGANGTIDDVRLYRRALTAENVRTLYNERTTP